MVVATRDRTAPLRRCLAALGAQDAADLELIVVDDGSADAEAVEREVAAVEHVRLLRAAGAGPAAARNLGIEAASGAIVCLTDDDCEPEPGWARLLAAAAAPGGAAAGRTVAPEGARAPVLASQAITNHLQDESLTASGELGFAPTCNLAATRELLLATPFDESYPDAAGEDRDWWRRALATGVDARFEPGAVVVHRQRLDGAGLMAQQRRYGRGGARLRRAGGGLSSPGFYARLVRAGFASGPGVGALVIAAQGAALAGVVEQRLRRG